MTLFLILAVIWLYMVGGLLLNLYIDATGGVPQNISWYHRLEHFLSVTFWFIAIPGAMLFGLVSLIVDWVRYKISQRRRLKSGEDTHL